MGTAEAGLQRTTNIEHRWRHHYRHDEVHPWHYVHVSTSLPRRRRMTAPAACGSHK